MKNRPSNCSNSPFVGKLNKECKVWPSILYDATPVGAATRNFSCKKSFKQLIRYDFPVTAMPVTIMYKGVVSFTSKCWLTLLYTCSCANLITLLVDVICVANYLYVAIKEDISCKLLKSTLSSGSIDG